MLAMPPERPDGAALVKIHNAFIANTNAGPRKLCDICSVYFAWFGRTYRCPSCGAIGNAQDVIKNTSKTLKADVPTPIIGKRKKPELKGDFGLPPGGKWIKDDTYNPV